MIVTNSVVFQKFTEKFRFHLFERSLKKNDVKLNPTITKLGETRVRKIILYMYSVLL